MNIRLLNYCWGTMLCVNFLLDGVLSQKQNKVEILREIS